MQLKLVVIAGASKAGAITIKPPMTLGRSRDADLTLRHALISRQHCEIIESGGALLVRDLGSLNGTFVASQRITESVLQPGDSLTVGSLTFRVEYTPAEQQPAAETAEQPQITEETPPADQKEQQARSWAMASLISSALAFCGARATRASTATSEGVRA